jgi:hypothetical protein
MVLNKQLTTALFICIGCFVQADAQVLTPQTVNTGGQSYSSAGILLESSIGGLVVKDVSNTAIMYTPDFLQPYAGTTTSIPVINNVVLNSGTGMDNAGTSFKAGNAMIDFTVGEFVSITHTNGGNMVTQGILQPYASLVSLPVTGLTFTAKRTSNSLVQLNWKTIQEFNNKGFYIERQKANESVFTSVAFSGSKAPDGNSSWSLQYAKTDTNSYSGKTWYRLKQEDIDGQYHYSVVCMVDGYSAKTVSLKAWPIPAVSNFNVMAEGIDKDVLLVLDMNGKVMQQINITNGVSQKVNNLPSGTYILRLTGHKDMVLKAVVVNGE